MRGRTVHMRAALLFSVLALGACAAPSSFDGITGGGGPDSPAAPATAAPATPPTSTVKTTLKQDASVAVPRPVSPISVSLISSKRPHLRWDLGATGKLTGAVVEMARSRDFSADVLRVEATGTDVVVPKDLDLGVWFWRVKGATATAYGTNASPIWEMVVRGPAAHGTSDMPSRSMVDYNGDGEPDLMVAATGVDREAFPSDTMTWLFFYAGDPVRGFAGGPENGSYWEPKGAAPYEGPVVVGGGTDLDGDGYTDVIESGLVSGLDDQAKRFFTPSVLYSAGTNATKYGSIDYDLWSLLTIGPASSLPSVREAGDVDGDGYGDAVVGGPSASYIALGNALRPTTANDFYINAPALLPVFATSDVSMNSGAAAHVATGGFDMNGDGLGDVVFSMSDPSEPSLGAVAAAGNRSYRVSTLTALDAPADSSIPATLSSVASAFAAGDFNGDGIDDLAVTMPTADATRVCIWYGNRAQMVVQGPCVTAPAGETEFGASLTAADLEGDGVDELLVTTKAADVGVRVVRVAGNGTASTTSIGVPGLGVRLTTIWPGRPGKARWAAVAADGSRIGVFEGTDLKTNMVPPSPDAPGAYGQGVLRGFGRGLR